MKRLLSLVLVLALIVTSLCLPMSAYALDVDPSIDISITEKTDALISKLLTERSALFASEELDTIQLDKIDTQLRLLGCNFLTRAEVEQKYPDAVPNYASIMGNGQVDPQARVPDQGNVTWVEHRSSNYKYNNKVYNIQKLSATANEGSSNIKKVFSLKVESNPNILVKITKNLIEVVAQNAVGLIPGSTIPLAIIDAAKAVISGLTTTSVISIPHILYSCTITQTIVFQYVRMENQSDEMQMLTHISSASVTNVGYLMSNFSYTKNNAGQTIAHPGSLYGDKDFYAVPEDFNSSIAAIRAYNSYAGGPHYDAVSNVTIKGIDGRIVHKEQLLYPAFPAHIY